MGVYRLRPIIPDYQIRMRRYANMDQRAMNKKFASFFDDEVDNHAGFSIGSQSYVILGDDADNDCEVAVACLSRASYSVVRLGLVDLVVAATGGYDDDDIFHTHIEAAQCCFVFGMFDPVVVEHLDVELRLIIAQFITRLVDSTVSVILPINESDEGSVDLGLYGMQFADLLADKFKVYKYGE